MFDAKIHHSEFDRRADAVIFAAGLVGWYEVGHVAHDEQLARRGAEYGFGTLPAIGAGDDHGVRVLPAGGEFLVVISIRHEVLVFEMVIAVRQNLWEAASQCRSPPALVCVESDL